MRLSEIEPVVVDLVDRAATSVSDAPRPNGEQGPRPCMSGPPVRDLGTKSLHYEFLIDVEAGTEGVVADEVTAFLVGENLEVGDTRVAGKRSDVVLRGDGFRVNVIHVDGSGVVSVGGSTDCLDP